MTIPFQVFSYILQVTQDDVAIKVYYYTRTQTIQH
jgi:hypothetical protein